VSADHFDAVLTALLERRPFLAFTLESRNGRHFEIDHAEALNYSNGIAAFTAPGKILVLFDHDSIVHIFDCPASDVPDHPF
jgi:hypothetical protein